MNTVRLLSFVRDLPFSIPPSPFRGINSTKLTGVRLRRWSEQASVHASIQRVASLPTPAPAQLQLRLSGYLDGLQLHHRDVDPQVSAIGGVTTYGQWCIWCCWRRTLFQSSGWFWWTARCSLEGGCGRLYCQ